MKNTTIHQISIEDYKKLIDSIDDFSSTIESSRALLFLYFLMLICYGMNLLKNGFTAYAKPKMENY